MKIYYLVLDYCGWCVYQASDMEFKFNGPDWQYQFSTHCLDVANGVCKIANQRMNKRYAAFN